MLTNSTWTIVPAVFFREFDMDYPFYRPFLQTVYIMDYIFALHAYKFHITLAVLVKDSTWITSQASSTPKSYHSFFFPYLAHKFYVILDCLSVFLCPHILKKLRPLFYFATGTRIITSLSTKSRTSGSPSGPTWVTETTRAGQPGVIRLTTTTPIPPR